MVDGGADAAAGIDGPDLRTAQTDSIVGLAGVPSGETGSTSAGLNPYWTDAVGAFGDSTGGAVPPDFSVSTVLRGDGRGRGRGRSVPAPSSRVSLPVLLAGTDAGPRSETPASDMAAHNGVPSGYDSDRAAEERRRGDGMRSSRGILDSIRAALGKEDSIKAASGRDASGGAGGRRSRSADYRAAFGSAFRVVSPSSLAAGRRRTRGRPGAGEDPPAGPSEELDPAAYTTAGDPPGAEEDEADRPDREGR
ncbi:hypothetical protein THAOC_31891, partial [Thalassiosira oceanica]